MAILGGNILNRAMAVVGSDNVQWQRFMSRTLNDVGIWVPTYAPAVTIKAQVQEVKRSNFQYMGLDYEKSYISIYTTAPLKAMHRDGEADRFLYGGSVYEMLSDENWKRPQGYVAAIAVRVA